MQRRWEQEWSIIWNFRSGIINIIIAVCWFIIKKLNVNKRNIRT